MQKSININPVLIIRLILTAWLLLVVWHHAHWSVVLCLALGACSDEIHSWFTTQFLRALKKAKML